MYLLSRIDENTHKRSDKQTSYAKRKSIWLKKNNSIPSPPRACLLINLSGGKKRTNWITTYPY